MATSGSFDTNKVGNFYCTVSWSRVDYSSSENKHKIYYKVVAHNSSGSYRSLYDRKLTINNSEDVLDIYTSSGTAYHDGDVVTDGYIWIPSDNDAGELSLPIWFGAGVGSYHGYNASGSDRWSVDAIPRYPTGCSRKS